VPVAKSYRNVKESENNQMYVTNQFSYYIDSPVISRRVANEVGRSLSLLNEANLRPPVRPLQCSPLVFDLCENYK
jgi:hypothetical protein